MNASSKKSKVGNGGWTKKQREEASKRLKARMADPAKKAQMLQRRMETLAANKAAGTSGKRKKFGGALPGGWPLQVAMNRVEAAVTERISVTGRVKDEDYDILTVLRLVKDVLRRGAEGKGEQEK
jgi:protocatechuate 3,4-dioxygenase beta subunit